MKRALWTIGMVVILGMASISCETSSSLEDIVVEDEIASTQGNQEDEEKSKPSGN